MATRRMYKENPSEFLSWYHLRFATYRHHGPNDVHHWLADKNLITLNIYGLDCETSNEDYISSHGRLDQMTYFHHLGNDVEVLTTPWHEVDKENVTESLLTIFNIENESPNIDQSFEDYVLLFDEYYTELYRISEAQQPIRDAEKIVFMRATFSVNITQIALDIAMQNRISIELVGSNPDQIPYEDLTHHIMTASEYVHSEK